VIRSTRAAWRADFEREWFEDLVDAAGVPNVTRSTCLRDDAVTVADYAAVVCKSRRTPSMQQIEHDPRLRLSDYEVQLAALRVENELLRQSAQAFGDLAERLNRALIGAATTGCPEAISRSTKEGPPASRG
jgi:hypothetical protein